MTQVAGLVLQLRQEIEQSIAEQVPDAVLLHVLKHYQARCCAMWAGPQMDEVHQGERSQGQALVLLPEEEAAEMVWVR
jgi:hypothetical protein